MSVEQVKIDPAAVAKFREAVAYGALNYGYAVEGAAKANAPVHGAYRSFVPGQQPIGGTLRRSIHTVVYANGRKLLGASNDENGEGVPQYDANEADAVIVVVGTNIFYAIFVHNGTVKMAARPFMSEAILETKGEAESLILAGTLKHIG